MIKKLRVFVFFVFILSFLTFKTEAGVTEAESTYMAKYIAEVESRYTSDHYVLQSMRSENWRSNLLAERLNGNKSVDEFSLKKSLWYIVLEMLHDFRISAGWFIKELRNQNGTINFGNVAAFSDAEKRYVLLANALIADQEGKSTSLYNIANKYAPGIFTSQLIKEAQEYIDYGLLKKRIGYRVGNSEYDPGKKKIITTIPGTDFKFKKSAIDNIIDKHMDYYYKNDANSNWTYTFVNFEMKEISEKVTVTELSKASADGDLLTVQKLVKSGADVNKATDTGDTPLMTAYEHGHEAVVNYLKQKGAKGDINSANKYGWTPLYIASNHGNLDTVKYLIEEGADVNKADNSGKTPLYVAREQGYQAISELLRSHGAH